MTDTTYIGTVTDALGATASAPVVLTSTVAPPPSAFPMSFNDPIFANVTAGTVGGNLANGTNLTDKSFANGNNGNQIFAMFGNNVLTRVRVGLPTREGPRIAGSGLFQFNSCWIEVNGIGADHADCIQAYSPGDKGTLFLNNTTIRAHIDGVGSVGVFIADDWTGTFKCRNVLFWSGEFGCRAFPDVSGDIHIDFQDVYFVGPFGFGSTDITNGRVINGHRTIVDNWTNVRNATIVNGVIVPGSVIPFP